MIANVQYNMYRIAYAILLVVLAIDKSNNANIIKVEYFEVSP